MNLIEAVENGKEQGFKVVYDANFINSNNDETLDVKIRYYLGRDKKGDFLIQDTLENIITQQKYLVENKYR